MEIVRLADTLTLEQAEHAANGLLAHARRGSPLHLDLSRLRSLQPGAAVRLGNSLRVVAQDVRALTVTVPDDYSGAPKVAFLADCGLGQQIAAHATTICTRKGKKTREIRALLRNAAPPDSSDFVLHDLARSPAVVSRSTGSVATLLDQWLEGLAERPFAMISAADRMALAHLISEAAWNVQDHSGKAPLPESSIVTSTLAIKWISREGLTLVPEGFAGEDKSRRYFDSLMSLVDGSRRLKAFAQIIVNDDGVGIAARQGLDAAIYRSHFPDEERALFMEALSAGGTVKLRARDCLIEKQPGFGSTLVADAIHTLLGYASIRSGRFLAFLNGNTPVESITGFEVEESPRAFIPGTTLQVVVPVFDQSGLPRERNTPPPSGTP